MNFINQLKYILYILYKMHKIEYQKQYYEANKKIYLKKRKESCYCNVCFTFQDYFGKHLKTKKHILKISPFKKFRRM